MRFPEISKHISLFLGGHSVEELIGEKFNKIKENTFTVAMNHSFARLEPHALIWQDYNVTKDLVLWMRRKINKKQKLPYLWTRKVALEPQRTRFIPDYENLKILNENVQIVPKDKKSGSYTSGLAINFLRKQYPDKKIFIFGLDMRGDGCWYDRYFEPIKKIKKPWDMNEYEIDPRNPCTSKPIKFVRKAREDLNVWINDKMIFNCNKQSNFNGFDYKDMEEIWHMKI